MVAFTITQVKTQHVAVTIFPETNRDQHRRRINPALGPDLGVDRIQPDIDITTIKLPVFPNIKRIDNKENKNLRIERTETIIETAKVLFPEGQDTPTLISQFLTYPDGYIDGCDALAGCLERFSEYDIGRNRVKVRRFGF